MPKGGARQGAGRPLTAGELRKRCTLRATAEEWELHKEFDKILKYGDKIAAKDFVESHRVKK